MRTVIRPSASAVGKTMTALIALAMLMGAEHATAQTVPAAGTPQPNSAITLEPSSFRYRLIDNSLLADELATHLPAAPVSAVLADADRNAPPCVSPLAMAPLPAVSAVLCWESTDAVDPTWYPQGITTTADAFTIGTYQNETVIVASWYHTGSQGSRISLIDYSDPSMPKYRHALLVKPSLDGTTFGPVPVHAGGIAWYGDLLYVVDTSNGFRVFDMRRILRVQEGAGIGLQADGSYRAHGYRYVLPQTLTYEHYTTNSVSRIRHSFLSLDRTSYPDSVVVGEYQEGGSTAPKRLVRIAIDSRTRLLGNKFLDPIYATDVGGEQALETGIVTVQGAASINGRFLLGASGGGWYGTLYAVAPGALLRTAYLSQLPHGTEDFSYWASRDELWTLAELPDYRAIIALKASSYLQ